jgi:hypothetical protein
MLEVRLGISILNSQAQRHHSTDHSSPVTYHFIKPLAGKFSAALQSAAIQKPLSKKSR